MSIESFWYKKTALSWLLWPLSLVFGGLVRLRRLLYALGVIRVVRFPVTVVVVGNISVGGTGKSPLIVHLAQLLRRQGLKVGLVARGYGGRSPAWPCKVTKDSDPALVGDEAVMLVKSTQCPMFVSPSRVQAVAALLKHASLDVVLSDDGLQHYALGRDIEIAVVDSVRYFGNGFLLPAGPLRESKKRLEQTDFVIFNGAALSDDGYTMRLSIDCAYQLKTGCVKKLSELRGKKIIAVAGIGHPQRFFSSLESSGLTFDQRVFPDHHVFVSTDLRCQPDEIILMTEKDAVKCVNFDNVTDLWCVPATVETSANFKADLYARLIGG